MKNKKNLFRFLQVISIIIILSALMYNTCFASTMETMETETNITQETITQEKTIHESLTFSICYQGELYCYFEDVEKFLSMGNIDLYHFWLDDGFYIIKWNGNIYEDEQKIIFVIDLVNQWY